MNLESLESRITPLLGNEFCHIDSTTKSWTQHRRPEIKVGAELEEASKELGHGHAVVVPQHSHVGCERAIPAVNHQLLFYNDKQHTPV